MNKTVDTATTPNKKDEERERLRLLALQIQQGDKESYQQLLDEVYERVSQFIAPRVSSTEIREDIVQEIVLSVHVSLPTYSGRDSFPAWLFTIARRRFIDYLRKKKRRNVEEIADVPWFELQPAEEEMASLDEFMKQMDKLPDVRKRAIQLIHFEGRSISEAAKELKITENNFRVTLHRAVKELKLQLREEGGV